MAQHNELGKLGEQMAREYLVKKGYTILSTNYRFKKNELDIVGKIGNEIVVVEVKTRNSDYLADPSLMVPKSKQKGIIAATNAYIQENEIDAECRFDVITVLINNEKRSIEHIEDAFYPLL